MASTIDYSRIESDCLKNSAIVKRVLDDFLLYYVAAREKLDKKVDRLLRSHSSIVRSLPKSWTGFAKSQYIAHELFREGGLLAKYLQHSMVNELTPSDMNWLKGQLESPWRFSYATILERPAPDFFVMFDVFTNEEYLLYSPGLTKDVQKGGVSLCFNLIANNGSCWQTYGAIVPFRGVEKSDIAYFNELLHTDEGPETTQGVMESVARNPIPYMLLLAGAEQPFVYHNDTRMIFCVAEYECDALLGDLLNDLFDAEYTMGVHRLALKNWDRLPHFSTAYFDENEERLFLLAYTEMGFTALIDGLRKLGYQLLREPDFKVNPPFFSLAQEITGVEDSFNPYGDLFSEDQEYDPDEMERINDGLAIMMDHLNNDRDADVTKIALQTGMNPEMLEDLYREMKRKTGR